MIKYYISVHDWGPTQGGQMGPDKIGSMTITGDDEFVANVAEAVRRQYDHTYVQVSVAKEITINVTTVETGGIGPNKNHYGPSTLKESVLEAFRTRKWYHVAKKYLDREKND